MLGTLSTQGYLTELHKRMFGTVWTWVGAYRIQEVKIGETPPHDVAIRVRAAFDDARRWAEHKTHGAHELAIHLHHRLVLITVVSGAILTAIYLWRRDVMVLILAHVATDLYGLVLASMSAALR